MLPDFPGNIEREESGKLGPKAGGKREKSGKLGHIAGGKREVEREFYQRYCVGYKSLQLIFSTKF